MEILGLLSLKFQTVNSKIGHIFTLKTFFVFLFSGFWPQIPTTACLFPEEDFPCFQQNQMSAFSKPVLRLKIKFYYQHHWKLNVSNFWTVGNIIIIKMCSLSEMCGQEDEDRNEARCFCLPQVCPLVIIIISFLKFHWNVGRYQYKVLLFRQSEYFLGQGRSQAALMHLEEARAQEPESTQVIFHLHLQVNKRIKSFNGLTSLSSPTTGVSGKGFLAPGNGKGNWKSHSRFTRR